MTRFSRESCELSDEDLDRVVGGKGASLSSFWTTLGKIVLGPTIGTVIGGRPGDDTQDAA